jgi:septum formation protein
MRLTPGQGRDQVDFYLASNSPRRVALLTTLGARFQHLRFRDAQRPDEALDETPREGEDPWAYALRVAQAKAHHGYWVAGQRAWARRLVLAADTTLDVDGRIIGKPENPDHARTILRTLSARAHRVITAIVLTDGQRTEDMSSVSQVRFRHLDADEINRYVDSGAAMDKAGAYGLQEYAACFVSEIQGSCSGIAGLPLCETALLLRSFGLVV